MRQPSRAPPGRSGLPFAAGMPPTATRGRWCGVADRSARLLGPTATGSGAARVGASVRGVQPVAGLASAGSRAQEAAWPRAQGRAGPGRGGRLAAGAGASRGARPPTAYID
ncbi:unnamed protein product [Miscanthus lutarioriparius]|uniref:Uncharacterized protein n=1 Tax=Miscanthus lutarioriparius TaxID=422564 RepID=A0A811NPI9_9POAL|nr:unnamed protein product [Miscanthus lutarioriparius]